LQERIYNDHVRLLSPEPVGWLSHHQLYSDVGADIVMELITLIDRVLDYTLKRSRFPSTRFLTYNPACSPEALEPYTEG
jgi:hypothetical protein